MDTEQRTEEPTPRKLRKARERGEVALSPLATGAIGLLGGGVALALGAEGMLASWRQLAVRSFTAPLADPREALVLAGQTTASALVWPLTATLCCGALASFLQAGPLFAPKALVFDLTRLDPARGLARMFSPAELGSRFGLLLLVGTLFGVGAWVLGDALPGLVGRTAGGAPFVLGASYAVLRALFERALPVLLVAGAVALVYRRWRFRRGQRMTRRELLDERRETEGEPEARRRRAELHREAVRETSVEEAFVGAALVVRAPGRALVLRWDANEDAPPTVSLAASGPLAQRVALHAARRKIPAVHDAQLADELERVRGGHVLSRASLRRLARHLARARTGR